MMTESKDLLQAAISCTKEYGAYTIEQRAIPDYRDGLKPVQRRVLWSAFNLGLNKKNNFVKCARVVGDCLGRFHPHGDTACYQALVNVVNSPTQLFDGQGNFGDHTDGAAAMRYCVAADTFIYTTTKGMVRVKDIVEHDPNKLKSGYKVRLKKVFYTPSLNSSEQSITHWIYSGKHEVVEITTGYGVPIKCTLNHPFLVVTKDGFKWVEARNIKKGDYICTTPITCNSNNKDISKDEAILLGLIIGDGWVTKHCIGFNNTNKTINNIYRKLASKYLSVPKERICSREGKKVYRSLEINNTELVKQFAEKYDIPVGNSRMRYIPKFIFTQSKEIVSGFLSGLFESEATVSPGKQIHFSSSSKRLCQDIQNILMGFFNIRSGIYKNKNKKEYKLYISGLTQCKDFLKSIKFLSKRKSDLAAKSLKIEVAITAGNSKRDIIPFVRKNSKGYEVHKTREKFIKNYNSYNEESKNKYRHHITGNYIYSKVTSITRIKEKEHVYDVTVPKTHAFTANGYIVHNTECSLSKYSNTFLLDPIYLNCVPMAVNYDGKEKEPVYLPAKLPNLLINGSQGIATGCSVVIPSFTKNSVAKIVVMALKGVKITPKLLAKNLKFNFTYGGNFIGENADLISFFKTGEGSLLFSPEIEEVGNRIIFHGLAPRFNMEKTLNRLADLKGVKSVDDKSSGNKIEVEIAMSERDKGLINKIYEILTSSLPCSTMITIRHDDGENVSFKRVNIVELIEMWIDWRISFESKVIESLLDIENRKLQIQEWLLFAVLNREIIIKALNEKDPDTFLVKKLKISAEQAKFTLDQQVRKLAKLEEKGLKLKIKDHKKIISELKADNKNKKTISNRIIKQLINDFTKDKK